MHSLEKVHNMYKIVIFNLYSFDAIKLFLVGGDY